MLSQMKRLHCAAQLSRLVFLGSGRGPKVQFSFFRLLHPPWRAIALAHGRGFSAISRGACARSSTSSAHGSREVGVSWGSYNPPSPHVSGWWTQPHLPVVVVIYYVLLGCIKPPSAAPVMRSRNVALSEQVYVFFVQSAIRAISPFP